MAKCNENLKVLILVTEDGYFWSHRLPLARKLRDMGVKVLVMTHMDKHGDALRQEGFFPIHWDISRGGLNPYHEFDSFIQVLRVYRKERPDLVHHVALKPIVYGGLAARLCGNLATVHAVAGLGHVFVSRSWKMKLLRLGLVGLLRGVLNQENSRIIFQNLDNQQALIDAGAISEGRSVIIQGCGVNLREYFPRPEPSGVPVVVLPCRMLWDKGVGEFVGAARIVREQGLAARFVMVGDSDPANPASVHQSQLRAWSDSGIVEWWGNRTDMPNVFAQSNLVCLPSYAEGLPKVLIEAAACERAIVTTDAPGCRDVVRHCENGFLVPPRSTLNLAEAVVTLLKDPNRRLRMGVRGRQIAVDKFSEDLKIEETFSVYRDLLGAAWLPLERIPRAAHSSS